MGLELEQERELKLEQEQEHEREREQEGNLGLRGRCWSCSLSFILLQLIFLATIT